MPEGPEIRRAADSIGKAIVGTIVQDIYFAFERLQPFSKTLRGQRISIHVGRGAA